MIKVNDKVYMHGGIASAVSEDSLAALNDKLRGELKAFLDSMDGLRAAGVILGLPGSRSADTGLCEGAAENEGLTVGMTEVLSLSSMAITSPTGT